MRNGKLLRAMSLAIVASGPALAQDAAEGGLEEIVVTATKREQTLQDVPISVAVADQATLEQAHIRDLIDLQSIVPSLKITQFNAVGQTNFIIRGFGNGSGNDGIESSVGVFVDGVYRSRTSSALDDLPEVERIEVLRGPQSTLFGKNVSAGAINIVTARPQDEFAASTEVSFGNYGLIQGRGWFNAPLGDTAAIRISGSANQRDGYMTNRVTGNEVNDRDRWSARADFLWEPADGVALRVIGDYNEITEVCCGTVQLANGPASQFIGAALGEIGDPATKFERDIIFNTDPTNKLTGKGLSAQLDWELGSATLTSITAYRDQTNESRQDVDFTGADLSNKVQPNEIETFTQELRLASDGEGRVNWLIGAFFQDESLDSGVETLFGSQMRAFANGLVSAFGTPINTLEQLQGLPVGSRYFVAGQGISDFYTMDQRAYSAFSQLDFALTDKLTLTGGVAYLSDRKEAQSNVVLTDRFSLLNLQTLFGGAFAGLNALQFFYGNTPNHAPVNFPNANESGVLDDSDVTYALRVAYDFGIVNAYASYSTGWKAGAYNLSSDSRPPDQFGIGRTARPEESAVYELGLKAAFRGGYVNLAVFDQTIEDFQSNAYTGTGYALVNAGEESVQGVELDAAFSPVQWLNLTAAVTYLDAEYDSFTRAPCVPFDPRCPAGVPFRDLSGKSPAGIPELSASASATFTHQFGNGYGAYLRAEYDYTDDTHLTETVPEELATYGQSVVNASVGLTNDPHQFEVMLWARNLTDDEYIIGAFPTVAQTGSYSGFPNQPRTYGVTLRKKF